MPNDMQQAQALLQQRRSSMVSMQPPEATTLKPSSRHREVGILADDYEAAGSADKHRPLWARANEHPACKRALLCRFALLSVWLLVASGCGMPSSSVGDSAQQSRYALDHFYKDPKAQALALAAEQGNAVEVTRLMKQEHVNPDVIFSDDDSGMPLVAWPVFTLNPTGLKALLDNGANPNARKPGKHRRQYKDGSQGESHYDYDNALVWAAKQDDPVYLKLLLDHGGDPETRNGNNETLLFQAYIWHNQWKNVQLLVERGANINAVTQMGTVLYDYSTLGGFEKSYWLLQHGADPTIDAFINPLPPAPPRHRIIEAIFWHPGNPSDSRWQRLCQQWLLQHGFKRPPMPDAYREMRKSFGFPFDEKNIPLL